LEKERAEMRAMIDLLQSEITAATKQKPIATTQAVLEPPPNLKSSNST
jgi:hypothetical protein